MLPPFTLQTVNKEIWHQGSDLYRERQTWQLLMLPNMGPESRVGYLDVMMKNGALGRRFLMAGVGVA